MNKFNFLSLCILLLSCASVSADNFNRFGDDGPDNSSHFTCLYSPIDDLREAVRSSNRTLIQNHFGEISAEDRFTKRLDFQVLLSEKKRFLFVGPESNLYQKEFNQFLTMLIIQGAFEEDNDVTANFYSVVKTVIEDEPSNEMAGGYINLNYKLTNNIFGTEALNIASKPYSQEEVKRVIRSLDLNELCIGEKLIDMSDFIKLVRQKLN